MMLMTLTSHRKPASKKITLVIKRESKTYFEMVQEKREREANMPPPRALKSEELDLDNLQDCGSRYELGYVIGSGVCADVYEALDTQNAGKKVSIKVQKINPEFIEDIKEEYRMLRDLSQHPNIPDFYGAYMKKHETHSDIWFVMQYCEGGPVTDLVRALIEQGKRLSEQHIAFILKEIITGMVFLHINHVMHRDLRGSNILLTKDGEVKIVDFGLSRETTNTFDKKKTYLGSPSWMAPEIMRCGYKEVDGYDNRIDVWALGITAIELGDGKPPFEDMHPTRALFQIVRNPPPGLYRSSNWSQHFVDFIAECLEKNPDHRPFMAELLEHPFISELPENDLHLASELKVLLENVTANIKSSRREEARIRDGFLKYKDQELQTMHVEDLAALETISEDLIVQELEERHNSKNHYTFVGDVLLFINPNTHLNLYGTKYHFKYKFKSRSDNAPHIFAVADSAYQDMMHHEEAQHIVLAGEILAGKTTSMRHLLKHLIFLGQGAAKVGEKIEKCINVIHAIGNAGTPINANSTRHVMYMQITYGSSGKLSGSIFWLYQLEKWRVTGNRDPLQANFHIFYYFYDAMEAAGELEKYHLAPGRKYRYLRAEQTDDKIPKGPRETPEDNVTKFQDIYQNLNDIEFDEIQMEMFSNVLAAILLIGEIQFDSTAENTAELANPEVAASVAKLLTLDEKKFQWSLCNYCVVKSGTAERRRHTKEEAEEAREVLARTLYVRLADWIVNVINLKLSLIRAIFGDKHCVGILDMYGFECYQKNEMEQLFVNTLNEQLQYSYNQKVFVWEMQEQEEEEVPITPLQYYDNKPTIDELLNKPEPMDVPNAVFQTKPLNGSTQSILQQGINQMTLDMERAIRAQSRFDNVLFAPLSIVGALALVLLGADGETKRELVNFMGVKTGRNLDNKSDVIHKALGAFFESLQPAKDKPRPAEVRFANGIFYESRYKIKKQYEQLAAEFYRAENYPLDFGNPASAHFVNKWVANRTEGRIENLLPGPLSPQIVLILANVIYFKGQWEVPFQTKYNKWDVFHGVNSMGMKEMIDVEMMTQMARVEYSHSQEGQVLGLPYKGDAVYMYFILPKNPDLKEYTKDLSHDKFLGIIAETSVVDVIYTIPKIKLTNSIELRPILNSMNVTSMFDISKSDLSNMLVDSDNSSVAVDQVFHKVDIELSEEGTEAAASTGIIITRITKPMVKVNRPFIFFIYHRPANTILFWGSIYKVDSNSKKPPSAE
uniref:Neither inactivation nor afterpotential protein C n=1 Tax=Cacopsylla melanoneura TaxID=428564 RepID=A0A8D8MAI6_9HEMI